MIPTPTDRAWSEARHHIQTAVAHLVTDAYGSQAVTWQPVFPGAASRQQVADPLPGLWTIKYLDALIKSEARRYARRARETGHPWARIGAMLRLPDGADHTTGQAAFVYLADNVFGEQSFTWCCSDRHCGQLIHDYGPGADHPDEAERGHASGCARHAEDLAAWARAENGPDQIDGQGR
ncbi:hypothetical protein [Planobispora takensis]|uniref:Uncharacterized protein n=1 Tax=Planobispora takensis TaxID=1367882 RepID=A0A8J3T527_9ACTN|nr:hypothetical protein [Planobispora takensis]GII05472.1 hypothetical protein Pta02_74800 [Planobispora takensis]